MLFKHAGRLDQQNAEEIDPLDRYIGTFIRLDGVGIELLEALLFGGKRSVYKL